MKFKPGDLVIKNTGGNKMKIISCENSNIECAWFTESYHESSFTEEELIPFNQYKSVLVTEKRDDLIEQILNETLHNKD